METVKLNKLGQNPYSPLYYHNSGYTEEHRDLVPGYI